MFVAFAGLPGRRRLDAGDPLLGVKARRLAGAAGLKYSGGINWPVSGETALAEAPGGGG